MHVKVRGLTIGFIDKIPQYSGLIKIYASKTLMAHEKLSSGHLSISRNNKA